MKTDQKVSVIIPTFNRSEYLVQSLESVLGQTYGNLEVIVIDDGSTDDTEARLQLFKGDILYLKKENGGKSSAVNLGLRSITGDYVWVFDDDDIALPDKVEQHMALLGSDPEIGFVYTGFTTFEGKDTDHIVETIEADVFPENEMLAQIISRCFISHVTVVARKHCYDRIGHYDERLTRLVDYDITIRLIRAGFKAGVIQKPLVKVRQHKGMRGSRQDRFEIARNQEKNLLYLKLIMQKLYWELPPEAFLPCDRQFDNPLQKHFKAVFRRLWAVSNPMLVEEVKRDLKLIKALLIHHSVLTLGEKERVFLSALCKYAAEKGHPDVTQMSEAIFNL